MTGRIRLRRGLQLPVGDRKIAIHVMSPDPADPAARIGVGAPMDGSSPESTHVDVVRVGSVLPVGDLLLRVAEIVIGDSGYVIFDQVDGAAE